MLELKKIAITGPIASGKTEVLRLFQELGAFTASADAIVHELLASDASLIKKIVEQFGIEVTRDGKIDRGLLARKVFDDLEALDRLEKLLYPMVLQKIDELYLTACRNKTYNFFVVEVPLLFEAGWDKHFNVTISLQADIKLCHERSNLSDYDKRMKRQLPAKEKEKKADYIIQNNGTLTELRAQVQKLHEKILRST